MYQRSSVRQVVPPDHQRRRLHLLQRVHHALRLFDICMLSFVLFVCLAYVIFVFHSSCPPPAAPSTTAACRTRRWPPRAQPAWPGRRRSGRAPWAALFVWRYLSDTASFVLCAAYSVKDQHILPKYSSLLKKTCVRQGVLDKWLPLSTRMISQATQVQSITLKRPPKICLARSSQMFSFCVTIYSFMFLFVCSLFNCMFSCSLLLLFLFLMFLFAAGGSPSAAASCGSPRRGPCDLGRSQRGV